MRKKTIALAMTMALTAGIALAQAPAGKPTPPPEVQKLSHFVGKWNMTGETKPNPMMPAGPIKSTDVCEWFEGGFAVVCKYEGTNPAGPTKGIGIMSYSPEVKAYTYYGTGNDGMVMTSVPRGTVSGTTWTYNEESMMGGKMTKTRYVINEISPTSHTFKWEMQDEKGAWITVMEGKATKAS